MTIKERFTITIPATLKTELEQAVPAGKRAQFTADALERALQEKARIELLDALDNLKSYPSSGDSVELLRNIRQGQPDESISEQNKAVSKK